MPDQNAAASEHAIMQEITQPLADMPDDPVGVVASVDFPVVLRGYDRETVDEYVRRTTQLVAELSATRSPESAIRRALERVGEEVTSILARAHETADGITSQSRAEAEERLMRARAESEELERDAHALAHQLERDSDEKARQREQTAQVRVQELDADVDRIWAERDRIVADVRRLSEELTELAGAAATRFPAATTDEAAVVARDLRQSSAASETPVGAPAPEQAAWPGGGPPGFAAEAGPGFAEAAPEFALRPEPGFSGEDDAELTEIPADVQDDPLATAEHEIAGDEFETQPIVAETAAFAVAPAVEEAWDADSETLAPEEPTSVFGRTSMRVIDLHHLGRERVIGCWQVEDVLIDPGPASCLDVLLAAIEQPPRALLLTHIHLDHAGAAGSLVRRWPELEVYVHERGASHLADPTRLLESARRLYGEDMETLWGEVLPVPEANLRVLSGGERLLDGRFEVAYTPGHASHHVSYLFERTAFVGDVGGVRIMPETLTIPPTPPPDIDVEAWHGSIDQVLRWKPDRLAMTHFGANEDIGAQLADLSERLDTWAALVHAEDVPTFVGIVDSEIDLGANPVNRDAYKQAAPPELIYAGLERYWGKREGPSAPDEDRFGDDRYELDESPRGSAAEASTHAGRSARASRWTPPSL